MGEKFRGRKKKTEGQMGRWAKMEGEIFNIYLKDFWKRESGWSG